MLGFTPLRQIGILVEVAGVMTHTLRRLATFTEANAWVHLPPESFARHFPSIRSVWQPEGGKVWVEAEDPLGVERPELAWWELESRKSR